MGPRFYFALGLVIAAAAAHSNAEEYEIEAHSYEPNPLGGYYVHFQAGQVKESSNVKLVLSEKVLKKARFSPSNHVFEWPMPAPTAALVRGIKVTVRASTKKVTLHLGEPLGREHMTWRVWVSGSDKEVVIRNQIYAEEPQE